MNVLDQELNIKDYCCSIDNSHYQKMKIPKIALYVQTINKCNARCKFCSLGEISDEFDYLKYGDTLSRITDSLMLSKISLTGGEPLLDLKRTMKIAEISRRYSSKICLNTNGVSKDNLKAIYPFVDQIDISRHHYDENVHMQILKTKVENIETLCGEVDYDSKITINCVMQKGMIDSYEKAIEFIECMASYGVKCIKFISLLPLTNEAIKNYVDPMPIIERCKKFTNSGMLYDFNMCNCFEFIYIAKCGKVVKVMIRNTINSCYSCVKQLVFNGKFLYDGFRKENIIY